MTEYINKQELISSIVSAPLCADGVAAEYLRGKPVTAEYLDGLAAKRAEMIALIDGTFSADVIKVVKCKDCVYCTPCRREDGCGICERSGELVLMNEDYCSRAKIKT